MADRPVKCDHDANPGLNSDEQKEVSCAHSSSSEDQKKTQKGNIEFERESTGDTKGSSRGLNGWSFDESYSGSKMASAIVRVDLPCIGCGYNLKGISPLTLCPECGLALRSTLAFVLDPDQDEIAPLKHSKRIGVALILIAALLLLAVGILWVPHSLTILREISDSGGTARRVSSAWPLWSPGVSGLLAIIAGLLTILFRKPTGELGSPPYRRGWHLGCLALLGFGVCLLLLAGHDMVHGDALFKYLDPQRANVKRTIIRLFLDCFAAIAMLGFPAVFRFLALRSMQHRVVQISHQGFSAMLVAVAIVTLGDIIRLVAAWVLPFEVRAGETHAVLLIGSMLILVGSGMLTLALLNSLMDTIRLFRGMTAPHYVEDEIVW